MKQKGAIYYQLNAMKREVGSFYLVIILLLVFMTVFNRVFHVGGFGGMESATLICVFVIGCCSFKEDFYFLIQGGVGRKTILKSQCISYAILCAGMAMMDTLLASFATLINRALDLTAYRPMLAQLYQWEDGIFAHIPMNFVILLAANLMLYSFGYLLAAISYRGGKAVTIGLSVGLPVGLFVLLPALLEFNVGLAEKLAVFFVRIGSSFGLTIGILLAGAVLFFGIGGLLQLGAQVKE